MELSYVLIPGRSNEIHSLELGGLEIHNRAFEFWRQHWDKVFGELDGSSTVASDFSRHDYVACLISQDKVVALHLYSVFRLDSLADRAHPYFAASFEVEFLQELWRRGCRKVMSMEYLTVSPDLRLSNPNRTMNTSFGHIVMGLGTHVQRLLAADAAIGPCRCDLKVDRLAKEYGAFTGNQRIMHNVPVVSAAIPLDGIQECSRAGAKRDPASLVGSGRL